MTITLRGALANGGALIGAALLARNAAAEADPFASRVDEGLAMFRPRAVEQRPLATALTEAIRSGDLSRAEAAYIAARPPYEEIEVLAASFPERDAAIDARPYAFAGGETDDGLKGFHKVEALLFRDEDLAAALPVAEELEGSLAALVEDLQALARPSRPRRPSRSFWRSRPSSARRRSLPRRRRGPTAVS
jgi:hypothetical protein